jgi:hypothetical protein
MQDYYNMNSVECSGAQLQNVYCFYIAINKKICCANSVMALKVWLLIWTFFCPFPSSPPPLNMKMTLSSIPYPYMWKLLLTGFNVLQEQVEAEEAKPPTKPDAQSLICYEHSLERENNAFTKQIKKLKNVSNSPFSYTSCSTSVAPVGHCSPSPTILQAEALCLKIYINLSHYSLHAEVWKPKHIFNIMWDVWELLSFQAVCYYTAVPIALWCSQM